MDPPLWWAPLSTGSGLTQGLCRHRHHQRHHRDEDEGRHEDGAQWDHQEHRETGRSPLEGSSAVAASGIASVIHHAPMSTVVAATMRMVSAEYSTPSFAPEDCATVSAAPEGKKM